MRFLAALSVASLAGSVAHISASEPSDQPTAIVEQARLEQISARLDSLERRVAALEQRSPSASAPGSAPAANPRSSPNSLSEVNTLVVRDHDVAGQSAEPRSLAPLCRSALVGALVEKGFVVVADDGTADAEVVLTVSYLQQGRGFLGITDESENVDLSYSVLVRSLPQHVVLFSYANDEDGKPGAACNDAARTTATRLIKAKAGPPSGKSR